VTLRRRCWEPGIGTGGRGHVSPSLPHARARERVVPISELVFGTLTQNRSSLEPSPARVALTAPPRQPVDLAAVARDFRLRCKRIAGNLDAIAQQQEPLIADPKTTMLELVLASHAIKAAIEAMRRAYWPLSDGRDHLAASYR
jgi:hypothetical protein